MSLEQIAESTAPTTHLRLDDSTHIHLTDDTGKLVISTDTGKPITIAQDLTSGEWYAKVATAFPPATKDGKARMADLEAAGAVHVPHPDERWRGVWVPMPYKMVTVSEPEKETAST